MPTHASQHRGRRLRYIGFRKAHLGEEVRLLIADDLVHVVGTDGSLHRELVFDADQDY